MIDYIEGFAFDDMMLIPRYSDVRHRADVDISVEMCKGFKFALPFVPSNMKTITELAMAKLMYEHKSLAIFHRFESFKTQLEWLETIKTWGDDATSFIGFSIGVQDQDKKNVDELINNGARIICIDIAHGFSKHGLEMTAHVARKYPDVLLISGNASMGNGAEAIWAAGADICKLGVGAGGICLTRIATGNGTPSLSSLADAHHYKIKTEKYLNRKLFLMNDGGCKSSGDVVKSLCFGDLTMCGNLFAGSSHTPGDIIEKNNKQYKRYVGSSTHRGSYTEGVEAIVEYKGDTAKAIQRIAEGVKSGLSYQGVFNLTDLKKHPRFVKITPAGMRESGAHDVIVEKD